MRSRCFLITGAVMVFLALCAGCGKGVDVVNDTKPVSTALISVKSTLKDLALLPADRRAARVQQDFPHLKEDVAYFLHRIGRLKDDEHVDQIVFQFGSLDRVRVFTGDGPREGSLRNQLIASVTYHGGRASGQFPVVVQSLADLSVLEGAGAKHLQTLLQASGAPVEEFTIGPRDGLIQHVGFSTAVAFAARYGLPLYDGPAMDDWHLTTPEQVQLMESTTGRPVPVAVKVREGDRFNLTTGVYTPAQPKTAPKAPRRFSPRKVRAVSGFDTGVPLR